MQSHGRNMIRSSAVYLRPNRAAQQRCQISSLSLVNSKLIAPALFDAAQKVDLDVAVSMVRKFDPVAYMPGLLLPTRDARLGYFAFRSFWVQTGLRIAPLPTIGNDRESAVNHTTPLGIEEERIRRWRLGIQSIYDDVDGSNESKAWSTDPTLRLIHYLHQTHPLSKNYFESILDARLRDMSVTQYDTVQDLINHGSASCANLINLILELEGVPKPGVGEVSSSQIYLAAKEVGIAHGLTNALRGSIPVLSTTGKLVVPAELCVKYGVKTPRYLLSALAIGDDDCKRALRSAVRDLVAYAREHLERARKRRTEVLSESGGDAAVSAFLPVTASETFLDRLEMKAFDLTDRNLRSVGMTEHAKCTLKLYKASLQQQY